MVPIDVSSYPIENSTSEMLSTCLFESGDAQHTFFQYPDPKVLVPRPEGSGIPFTNHRRNYCTSATCAVDQGKIVYYLILKSSRLIELIEVTGSATKAMLLLDI